MKVKTKVKNKKEKGASRFVVFSVCFMAAITIAVSVLSITTDVFKEDDSVKAMVLSALLPQDESELESHLSNTGALYEIEMNENTVSDELYVYMKPQNEGGLYSSFGFKPSFVTDTPDPSQRFMKEDGSYAYYKLDGKKVDSIIESFGLIPNHTLNHEQFYYYDGNYYYAEAKKEESSKNLVADIASSKRIEDGSYYIDCDFYSDEGKTSKEGKIYAIVEKELTGESGEINWKFTTISPDPIFDETGIMIDSDSEIKYEMKREYFEGKLSDGTVFCEYSIEYPFFTGDSAGENTANLLYSEVLSKYKKSAEEADKYFKDFKGTEDMLPVVVHLSSEVTYSDSGKISTIVDISEYNEAELISADETQEDTNVEDDETKPVSLAKRSVEGYIFDVETGEYITKDSVLGKDYQLISDLLYRIQGEYSYEDLLDEEIQRPSEIPADDTIGKAIYESGGAMTENGYVFCLVTEKGFVESVLLPSDIIEKITED